MLKNSAKGLVQLIGALFLSIFLMQTASWLASPIEGAARPASAMAALFWVFAMKRSAAVGWFGVQGGWACVGCFFLSLILLIADAALGWGSLGYAAWCWAFAFGWAGLWPLAKAKMEGASNAADRA